MPVINSIEDLRVIARRRHSARPVRLHRPRLLRRADLDAQSRRSARDRIAPARHGRCLATVDRHHRTWRALENAGGAGAHGAHGILPSRRRDRGGARRAGSRRALHLEHDVHLLDRRRACRRGRHVLVPALSHARSRLQCGADLARTRGALLRAHAHARSAVAGVAPAGSEERPVRAAAADAGQCAGKSCCARAGSPACC